jgi:RES domain-containing protein
MADLLGEDWSATAADRREGGAQAVGRAAFVIGLGGLIVPSQARPAGQNIVVFPRRLTAVDRLVVVQPDLLANLGKPA